MTRIAITIVTCLMWLAMQSQSVPAGTIVSGTHNHSIIYPGTERSYKVYVPAQYSGDKPACLLVCMDGILYDAAAKMDTLIAAGDMPVCIGVFVEPGVVRDSRGDVVRYNRSREFDTMNSHWAEFLEKELLPEVEGMTLADGRVVHISGDANDRAITGASSGGICAWSAAWYRPDLFSRVYTAVGTFVAMRGGNDYPALVRKTEPKPIRIFMQDGERDAWNALFGSWWEYNQLMHSALKFAGYEVAESWDKGGHSIRYGTLAFADAMRFLWKGWPEKVKKGNSENDMLKHIIDHKSEWEYVARYSAHSDTLYLNPAMAIAAQEQLLSRGHHFALSPDHKVLVQSEPGSNWLIAYAMGDNRQLMYGERFYWLHSADNDALQENGPMAFDTDGNLYVATAMGVQVCDQNGRVRAILTLPQGAVTNLSFVDNVLYVVCGGNIYRRTMKTRGYRHNQPKIEVKSHGQG